LVPSKKGSSVPADRPACRVEHRHEGGTDILATAPIQLAPIAAHLEAQGKDGELVVVDGETERVLIRWPLTPTGERASAD
jgi:hypothetical protein